MLPTSIDSFPHLIKKHRSQLGFVTYFLTYPRTYIHTLIKPSKLQFYTCYKKLGKLQFGHNNDKSAAIYADRKTTLDLL